MNIAINKLTSCLALACAVTANVCAAAEGKPFAAPQVAEHVPAASAGSLVQVTVSLLLVLAAVFAAGWVVRKLRGMGKFQSDAIVLIADLPLGTKERAVLVQVGSQQILLGVAPGRVNTLHVLAEPVTRADVSVAGTNLVTSATDRPDFKAILKRSLGL